MLVPSVKNLIFDLGGVILDLSVDHTLQSFAKLSDLPKEKVQDLYVSTPGFLEYEKGLIDDDTFREFVRRTFSIKADDAAIDACWNAMLRGIPALKLELLLRLQNEFRVFLLSNTNAIHLEHINGQLLPKNGGENSLDRYFHKAYYSHRMKKRKPDAEIFEQVLEENNLVPEETLFLDDYAVNIDGASALGIKTIHVTSPHLILDYFHA
ncbi:MAG TPA: HAD family phosphatase [Chryseosolibacter sp.]|nr:HAD family phosphatase [Chryseosolibacter sp.]